MIPRATYRLQLSGRFPLKAASALIPRLQRLGVSHVYSSPLLKARSGSLHGYDVVDPTQINPEIGTERQLRLLAERLHRHGMGLVLDIVPNHMATGRENPAWVEVLRYGRDAPTASWFDVDWDGGTSVTRGKVVLPVLGGSVQDVLARGEIEIVRDREGFWFRYFDRSFPLAPGTIPRFLDSKASSTGHDHPMLRDLLDELGSVRRPAGAADAMRRLSTLCRRSRAVDEHVRRCLAEINSGERRRALRGLLKAQAYRLVEWRRAGREVNYRRFFNINDLVGVRVGDAAVFEATHERILAWVGEGLVDGLRIDHVDGLLDPLAYLRRLRRAVSVRRHDSVPIYVEKILSEGERLRPEWPVEGATGYEFIADVEPLFHDGDGVAALEAWYRGEVASFAKGRALRSGGEAFAALARRAKRDVLKRDLAADVARLTARLQGTLGTLRALRLRAPVRVQELSRALVEVMVHLPVYRTYADARTTLLEPTQRQFLEGALQAVEREGRVGRNALSAVRRSLPLGAGPRGKAKTRECLPFVQRFQQLSGPAMAKGLEDTALYAWVPLVSRNEVGNAPERIRPDAVAELHASNEMRAACWPATMLAVSTHDTKRSADVRARLDVLSEIPQEWMERVREWRRLNGARRRRGPMLDYNTEYAFYQALLGIWPMPERPQRRAGPPAARVLESLANRLAVYMEKACREANERTSWVEPNLAFESELKRFVRAVLDRRRSREFLADVSAFAARVRRPGLWNSLSRTLIHLTAPGFPDVYQGDERWCFTLVDPDNRGPVDLGRRSRGLGPVATIGAAALRRLVSWPEDGRIKQHVIRSALGFRSASPQLFSEGGYLPLGVIGSRAAHAFAFARVLKTAVAVVIVPRLVLSLVGEAEVPPAGSGVWGDTEVRLPGHLEGRRLRNVLTGETVEAGAEPAVSVARALARFPVAMLVGS